MKRGLDSIINEVLEKGHCEFRNTVMGNISRTGSNKFLVKNTSLYDLLVFLSPRSMFMQFKGKFREVTGLHIVPSKEYLNIINIYTNDIISGFEHVFQAPEVQPVISDFEVEVASHDTKRLTITSPNSTDPVSIDTVLYVEPRINFAGTVDEYIAINGIVNNKNEEDLCHGYPMEIHVDLDNTDDHPGLFMDRDIVADYSIGKMKLALIANNPYKIEVNNALTASQFQLGMDNNNVPRNERPFYSIELFLPTDHPVVLERAMTKFKNGIVRGSIKHINDKLVVGNENRFKFKGFFMNYRADISIKKFRQLTKSHPEIFTTIEKQFKFFRNYEPICRGVNSYPSNYVEYMEEGKTDGLFYEDGFVMAEYYIGDALLSLKVSNKTEPELVYSDNIMGKIVLKGKDNIISKVKNSNGLREIIEGNELLFSSLPYVYVELLLPVSSKGAVKTYINQNDEVELRRASVDITWDKPIDLFSLFTVDNIADFRDLISIHELFYKIHKHFGKALYFKSNKDMTEEI